LANSHSRATAQSRERATQVSHVKSAPADEAAGKGDEGFVGPWCPRRASVRSVTGSKRRFEVTDAIDSVRTAGRRSGSAEPRASIVDCDVHPALAGGLRDLLPYMAKPLRRRIDFALSSPSGSDFGVPSNPLYMNPGGILRRDAAPGGILPGSDPDIVAQQLLDPFNISRAILLVADILGLGGLPDPHLSAEIARASNDWVTEKWLDRDDRYRGTITIAPQDPAGAAAEMARLASRRQFVQVYFPLTNTLMGDPRYYPIYEAAENFGLPIALHPGAESIYFAGAMPAGGPPTYYLEWHTLLGQAFAANVVSFLVQPVLSRFPELKLVVIEAGCGWVPDLLWRLDRDWMSVRDEVPWVTERPSTNLFKHVRFTTQPFIEPETREHLRAFCNIIHGDQTLLFSSDYPHWDFDNPRRVLNDLPDDTRARILATNALEFYGERLAEPDVELSRDEEEAEGGTEASH
jgi:predicted TIM-barrel fold metal-dependent hydrolase